MRTPAASHPVLLSTLAAVAMAACDPEPEDSGELDDVDDVDFRIEVGTNDVSTPERNAVVMIGGFCTGTLVDTDLVLTAAHCNFLIDAYFTGGWTNLPAPIRINFGPDRSSYLSYTANAIRVSAPPLPTGGPDWNDDIVLLRLDDDVPASVAVPRPVYLDHPAPLTPSLLPYTIFQIGYGGGRDRRIMTGGNYEDWMTFGSGLANNAFIYEADDLGVGDRNTNIEGGDSGGPMTLNNETGPVMGVLSHWNPYGIATYGPGGNGRPSIRDWLTTHLPTQKPDFEVVSIAAGGCTGSGGDPVVRVTIRNKGAVTARGWVDVFTALPSAPSIGTLSSIYRMSNYIAPEGTQSLSFAITDGFTSGWVDVLLDTTQSVAELDESNNGDYAWVNLPDCSFG